jgi:hypothetical protein
MTLPPVVREKNPRSIAQIPAWPLTAHASARRRCGESKKSVWYVDAEERMRGWQLAPPRAAAQLVLQKLSAVAARFAGSTYAAGRQRQSNATGARCTSGVTKSAARVVAAWFREWRLPRD